MKPRRVKSLTITVHSNLIPHIRIAKIEASTEGNVKEESLRGMER